MSSCPKWLIAKAPPAKRVAELAAAFGLAPLVVRLAMQRGFKDRDNLERFFYPRLKDLSDPFLLPGMASAIARLEQAIDRQEKVLLYGDYDVDGVSSLAFLHKILSVYGLEPRTFLPQRMEEGYGLSLDGLERGLEDFQPALVIAADCGTNSRAEADSLRGKGIDLVILDHHEPASEGVADCAALVNPKLGKSYHYLCTGGVVFKVAHALLKNRPLPHFDLRPYLDLVALATVADIVPLVEENRIFVRRGLIEIDRTISPGIHALKQVAKVGSPVRTHDIGFKLGPRLNASGRLDTAAASLDLLLTEDRAKACRLAEGLDRRNRERQTLEQRTRDEAEEQIAALSLRHRASAVIVAARGWHPGVVGIVASRIMKQYHRPTFVIAFDENGIGKGSGRSVPGISLIAALGACRDLLEAGGGHEMAAGLSIREENLEAFRDRFCDHIVAVAKNGELEPTLKVDAELDLEDLTLELLDSYELLRPFGNMNPPPLLMTRAVQVLAEPRVLKEKHLRLQLAHKGTRRDAMYFSGAGIELPRPPWDIVYTIERNEFQGKIGVTIAIQAIRKS